MIDVITYALCRKYVADTADGLGAVRGKNCTISKIEDINGGKEVTFQWTGDSGTVQTRTMRVMDGISITSGTIDDNNHLIITLSSGQNIDCGELPVVDNASAINYSNPSYPYITNVAEGLNDALSKTIDDASEVPYSNTNYPSLTNVKLALDTALSSGAKLEQNLTVSNPVGMATNGKTYIKNTTLETVIRDMLIKEVAPNISLAIVSSTTLYDVVDTVVSAITMKATCTKNTYNLSKVEFYLNNVLKHTQTISTNGTYTYDMIWDIPTNTDFTLKAIVYDSKSGTPMSASKSITVKFVGKSYYGTINADVGEPTEAIIKALQNNVLKDTKNLTYNGITMDYGKVVYAYPASFGNLSSIKDIPNNLQYWPNSFTKITVNVDQIPYNVYYQNDPSASNDVSLTFS